MVKSSFNESKLESAEIWLALGWSPVFVTVRLSALIAVLFQSHTATRDDEPNHTEVVLQLCDSAADSLAGKSCRSQLAVGNTPNVLQGLREKEQKNPQPFSQKQSGLSGQGRVLTQAELHHPSALVEAADLQAV